MFHIKNSQNLEWKVTIWWSKNAALPLIAVALLVPWKVTLKNVPNISDVHDFIHFYKSLGASIELEKDILSIDTTEISLEKIDTSKIARTRAWIYFIAWLLRRFWEAKIPFPSGDKIGKRPIDEHINGYVWMGYNFEEIDNTLCFLWNWDSQDVTITAYFAVTATANLIMWAASRIGKTTINLAAFEPHIFNLIDLLKQLWVQIEVKHDHTLIIYGNKNLKTDIEHEVISDYLQSWTFAIIWALCSKNYIDIERARIQDLTAFLYKLHEAGVKTKDLWNDILRVWRAESLLAVNIQTNIFPGFPTDLMPLFTVLMTQCDGISRVHEVLYEWRLNWLVEYERLWNSPRIINLHEAKITGPTQLVWARVDSWDLRSWAAMVIAWLIASWDTEVDNIYWISRWYDDFLWKLQGLWAHIQETDS